MSRPINECVLLTDMNPKSSLSETYRTLRTNTLFAGANGAPRTICVSSAVQGEGRTITAANLAISCALEGKKTLLVDADLRNPGMHKVFRTTNAAGLTQYLRSSSPLPSFVQSTYIEGLSLVPSGPISKNPSELLSSERMEKLIAEALAEYEIVIFDTPPVLLMTDAQVVAARSDGVLFVVGSSKVKRDSASKAKQLLEHVHATLLGVVLNGKKKSSVETMFKRYRARAE